MTAINPSRSRHRRGVDRYSLVRRLKPLLFSLTLLVAPSSHAATIVDCFAPVQCSEIIRNMVSPKFDKAFPSSRYKIVVFGSVLKAPSEPGSAYAVVGISERVISKGRVLTLLPLKRYSASQSLQGSDKNRVKTRALISAVRAATHRMMSACERSKTCDVHQSY